MFKIVWKWIRYVLLSYIFELVLVYWVYAYVTQVLDLSLEWYLSWHLLVRQSIFIQIFN